MALSLTSALNFRAGQTAGTTPFTQTTGSFTPASNSLIVVFAQSINNQAGGTLTANSTVTGGGLTWTKRASSNRNASGYYQTVEIWTAPVTTGAAMTVKWSNTATANDNAVTMQIFTLTGYDTSTPVGATASATLVDSGAGSVTLSGTPLSTSIILAARHCESAGSSDVLATPGASWTELYDAGQASSVGYCCMETQWITGSTSTTVPWANVASNTAALGGVTAGQAIEILALTSTTYNVSLTETGVAADSVSAQMSMGAAISESGSAAETVTARMTWSGVWSDTGSAADTVTSQVIWAGAWSDTGTASDAVTGFNTIPATITESGAASDSQGAQAVWTVTLTETGTAADVVTGGLLYAVTLTESGTASDSLTGGFTFNAALSDLGSAADTLSNTVTFNPALSEAGAASDSLGVQATYQVALSESGAASDGVTGFNTITASWSDSGTASDSVAAQMTFPMVVTETGTASDSPSANQTFQVAVNEAGSVVDVADGSGGTVIIGPIQLGGPGLNYDLGPTKLNEDYQLSKRTMPDGTTVTTRTTTDGSVRVTTSSAIRIAA